ncbi:uncharacterized protein EI90DRAFT_3015472 [Cantharellus anzutake]|uniref:uncharacterized protein n=1 Tax=Cantharellus anzutake TaxID=1750568 RepID=UPI001905B1F0|nr:uncharacterized protein EI90DRAFT_3015472 [Cantharellus anzutake]KAF8333634.1 hypothetical protein EI90DRAFT_3015472 [Cantharellus anzutake]
MHDSNALRKIRMRKTLIGDVGGPTTLLSKRKLCSNASYVTFGPSFIGDWYHEPCLNLKPSPTESKQDANLSIALFWGLRFRWGRGEQPQLSPLLSLLWCSACILDSPFRSLTTLGLALGVPTSSVNQRTEQGRTLVTAQILEWDHLRVLRYSTLLSAHSLDVERNGGGTSFRIRKPTGWFEISGFCVLLTFSSKSTCGNPTFMSRFWQGGGYLFSQTTVKQ